MDGHITGLKGKQNSSFQAIQLAIVSSADRYNFYGLLEEVRKSEIWGSSTKWVCACIFIS